MTIVLIALSAVVLLSSLAMIGKAVVLMRRGTSGVGFMFVFGLAGMLGSLSQFVAPFSVFAQNALLVPAAVLWIVVAVRLLRERLAPMSGRAL